MKLKSVDEIEMEMMLLMGFTSLIHLYLRAFYFLITDSRHSNFYFKIKCASTSLYLQLKISCFSISKCNGWHWLNYGKIRTATGNIIGT